MNVAAALKSVISAAAMEAETGTPPRLRIKDVRLGYEMAGGKKVVAIDRISIDVPDNEFAVIVGPSGCGKSRPALSGRRPRRADRGRHPGSATAWSTGPGADRGMVVPVLHAVPWLTVRENVEFGLQAPEGSAAGARGHRQPLPQSKTGLAAFHDAYLSNCPAAMMVSVAIARALANDRKILPDGRAVRRARHARPAPALQKLLLQGGERAPEDRAVRAPTTSTKPSLLGDRIYVMTARPGRLKQEIRVPIPARARSTW